MLRVTGKDSVTSLGGAATCTSVTQASPVIGTVTSLFIRQVFPFRPGTTMFQGEGGKQIMEVDTEELTITKRSEQDAREKYGERDQSGC